MSTRSLITVPPQTDAELIRQMNQRLRKLETKDVVRVGSRVLVETEDGRVLLTGPGTATADVGNPVSEDIDLTALRGYVSPSDVALAVSGGSTKDLTAATQTQVQQDTATQGAQYTADNANSKAAELEARLNAGTTGYLFIDTFDRPFATDLGLNYVRSTEGAGGGTYGTDGEGYCRMLSTSGSQWLHFIDLLVDPSFTHLQQMTSVLNAVPEVGGGAGTTPSRHTLKVAMNTAKTDWIECRVESGYMAIGKVVGGVYTEIAVQGPMGMTGGDRFDVLTTQIASHFKWSFLRNGVELVWWEDFLASFTGPGDTDHLHAGMSNLAGTTVGGFWFTFQLNAPPIQQITFNDIIP